MKIAHGSSESATMKIKRTSIQPGSQWVAVQGTIRHMHPSRISTSIIVIEGCNEFL